MVECRGVWSLFREQQETVGNLEPVRDERHNGRKHGLCNDEEAEFWIYLLHMDHGIGGESLSFPRSDFHYVKWFGLATVEF